MDWSGELHTEILRPGLWSHVCLSLLGNLGKSPGEEESALEALRAPPARASHVLCLIAPLSARGTSILHN